MEIAIVTPVYLEILQLCAVAFVAGLVDAVAGGGGLIQIPGLFIVLPNFPVVALLGTNKFASIFGTAIASIRYLRFVRIRKWLLISTCVAAVFGSLGGARVASLLDKETIRPLVLVLLSGVWIFSLLKKDFGHQAADLKPLSKIIAPAIFISVFLGFYDGFFGPGTGSFLVFFYVLVLGLNFLEGAALSKVVNFFTNLAALSYFLATKQVLFIYAIPMAVMNLAGGVAGSHLAIKYGSPFVRKVFLIVTAALFIKLAFF